MKEYKREVICPECGSRIKFCIDRCVCGYKFTAKDKEILLK